MLGFLLEKIISLIVVQCFNNYLGLKFDLNMTCFFSKLNPIVV